MPNYDHWSSIECVKWNVHCVSQLCSRTPANTCESFEQHLPLASEELHSRSSAMWFEVPRSFMAFSLACGRFLEHVVVNNNSFCTVFLLSQHLNFEVFLPSKLYTTCLYLWSDVIDAHPMASSALQHWTASPTKEGCHWQAGGENRQTWQLANPAWYP